MFWRSKIFGDAKYNWLRKFFGQTHGLTSPSRGRDQGRLRTEEVKDLWSQLKFWKILNNKIFKIQCGRIEMIEMQWRRIEIIKMFKLKWLKCNVEDHAPSRWQAQLWVERASWEEAGEQVLDSSWSSSSSPSYSSSWSPLSSSFSPSSSLSSSSPAWKQGLKSDQNRRSGEEDSGRIRCSPPISTNQSLTSPWTVSYEKSSSNHHDHQQQNV